MNEPFDKVANLYVDQVMRVEVIDQTPCHSCQGSGHTYRTKIACTACGGIGVPGRNVVFWASSKQIELSLQDDERTLKIFITERVK
jgi:DnaJ-class molecular chaperone